MPTSWRLGSVYIYVLGRRMLALPACSCAFVKTPGACDLVCQAQLVWHAIKAALRTHARRGDKLLPFLLKFRDVVERLSHHLHAGEARGRL